MLPVRNVGCACRSYVDVVMAAQEEQVSLWAELNGAWRDVSIRRKPHTRVDFAVYTTARGPKPSLVDRQ
jgi:hypothetical protein